MHMAEMGLLTSIVAPSVVIAARRSVDHIALPGWLALSLFVVLHDCIVIGMSRSMPSAAMALLLHALLLLGAVLFWLPVLGVRRRLADPGRIVYLFVALPMIDLAGVYAVLVGDQAGGLAMIVAMLPAAVIAVGVAWRWMLAEERAAVVAYGSSR